VTGFGGGLTGVPSTFLCGQVRGAASQRLPRLSEFLIDHIQEIISFVAVADGSQRRETCISLLLSPSGLLRDAFLKSPANVQFFVTRLVDPVSDCPTLLRILGGVVDVTGATILERFPPDIIPFVIPRIDDAIVLDFCHKLLWRRVPAAQAYIQSTPIDDCLMGLVKSGSSCHVTRCLALLRLLIIFLHPTAAMLTRLQSPDRVSILLEVGINSPTVEIGDGAFHVVNLIVQSCTDCSGILAAVESRSADLCGYILRDRLFQGDKRYAIELVARTSFGSHITVDTIVFLVGLFFESPMNSFLHQSVLLPFERLAVTPKFVQVVRETGIIQRMIDAAAAREQTHAAFWGQVHRISEIVNEFVQNGQIPGSPEWDVYFDSVVRPTAELMKTNYGGDAPVVIKFGSGSDPDDWLPMYQCPFVDSCELETLSKPASSESDDSHEEEEEDEWEEEPPE
jgi:hypothetical protein